MPTDSAGVTELNPGIFQIRGLNGSSHSYVLKGDYMNVMIDSGADHNFPVLEQGLRRIGIKVATSISSLTRTSIATTSAPTATSRITR